MKTRRYSSPRPEGPFPLPRILFVKTSSLGDVVHNCPAVSDVARRVPGAVIDWVVEEAFAEVAALHRIGAARDPGRDAALARRAAVAATPGRRSAAFRDALRGERYDAVIDSQGLVKSALIARLRAAAGTAWTARARASRSPRVSTMRVHAVPADLHAVERNRRLAAAALGYAPDGPLRLRPARRGRRADAAGAHRRPTRCC